MILAKNAAKYTVQQNQAKLGTTKYSAWPAATTEPKKPEARSQKSEVRSQKKN
jgi:hypothetical protein